TQKRKRKKRCDVSGADVNSLSAVDDDRTENPNDQQRPFIVSPLHTQGRHCLRREKQQRTNAEVRWVPKVTTFYAQHILRHDRQHAAQRVWPKSRRAQEYADTDSGDVCACEIEPLAE